MTTRFYPIDGGHSRSTGGCLCLVRPRLFINRWYFEYDHTPFQEPQLQTGPCQSLHAQRHSLCGSAPPLVR